MSKILEFAIVGLAAASLSAAEQHRISGPYTHENLSIYLIHGANNAPGVRYLTLQEAIDQKKVTIYETSQVNELAIENVSPDDVYIQSGDIVKGGKQDRVIPTDFVLPADSGRLPISSFCIEHGRWTRRGTERADRFEASAASLPAKQLKTAAREMRNQSSVWREVERLQQRIAGSVGVASAALAPASPSSMQLTLENKQVSEATEAYVSGFAKLGIDKSDVIGYAFAVNGRISGAEVYASHDLFRRMWPKLLRASAVEALAERSSVKNTTAPDASAVNGLLGGVEASRRSSTEAGRADIITKDTPNAVLYETRDGNAWVHRSLVTR